MAEPSAPRMRRPSWRDPRLGVGVLLVAASVALGSWVVARADATVDVYQARVPLTPGDVVSAADLQIVQVRLESVESTYLLPGSDLVDASVVGRTVAAGELVPLTALTAADDIDVRPVQIPMSSAMQGLVSKGATVDLWVALPDPTSTQLVLLPPEELVAGVEVGDVHTDTSVFAGGDQVQLQVLIPEAELPAVLAALASEGEITVVPRPGGVG